jgi:4-amino-4-deoxy-L-arabinose transferase-like glycosyltransferase
LNRTGYNTDEAVYAGQAAAIAQDPALKVIFPVFRAHPLLFQFILALAFSRGVNDLLGRLVAVAVGIANVLLVYGLANLLYGWRAGLIAALILALMPYHVVVTRQVLLDGPMTLCATLALYLMARFAHTQKPIWLYAAGAGMGLTFLAKETGLLLVGAIYVFLALSPECRVRIRDLILATVCMAIVMAPFPLAISLSGGGGSKTTQNYLIWELFRRPNHEWSFYLANVPIAIGVLVVLAAIGGLWLLRHEKSWREKLLVAWVVVPVIFFQLWPVKGFQYLLPIAPPLAVLAGRTLGRWRPGSGFTLLRWRVSGASLGPLLSGLIAATLLIPSWQAIQPAPSGTFTAGTGGVPGGREAGSWVRDNIPQGARLLTIGPSMANILQFYGYRPAYGLAVSTNPLQRNPSYEPIANPDLQIRSGELQYVVWDSFSAARTSFFSDRLLQLAKRYHGRLLHTEFITVKSPEGHMIAKPVIMIYEVRP